MCMSYNQSFQKKSCTTSNSKKLGIRLITQRVGLLSWSIVCISGNCLNGNQISIWKIRMDDNQHIDTCGDLFWACVSLFERQTGHTYSKSLLDGFLCSDSKWRCDACPQLNSQTAEKAPSLESEKLHIHNRQLCGANTWQTPL